MSNHLVLAALGTPVPQSSGVALLKQGSDATLLHLSTDAASHSPSRVSTQLGAVPTANRTEGSKQTGVIVKLFYLSAYETRLKKKNHNQTIPE